MDIHFVEQYSSDGGGTSYRRSGFYLSIEAAEAEMLKLWEQETEGEFWIVTEKVIE